MANNDVEIYSSVKILAQGTNKQWVLKEDYDKLLQVARQFCFDAHESEGIILSDKEVFERVQERLGE